MAKKQNDNEQNGVLFHREVPKMPEGYYSGDKPNPNLRAFVEAHVNDKPYDPNADDYDVPSFDKPIETTKATAIYNMHTYWSKKPHDAVREYVSHYTKPDDMVLDPFCGSGGTALAALMLGRKAIAIDLSPAATFITKNYCAAVDIAALRYALNQVERSARAQIEALYETRCDRCGGKALTGYTVYSQVYKCPRCLEEVTLYDCLEIEGHTAKGKPKKIRICPHCHKKGVREEIGVDLEKLGSIPVMASYICKNGCKPSRAERAHDDPDPMKRDYFKKYDVGRIEDIALREIPFWYPKQRMMDCPEDCERWGLLWRPYLRGIERTCDFFTKRNLWALAALMNAINELDNEQIRDAMLFAFTGTLLNVSRLIQLEKTRRSPNTYYVPPIGKEIAVWASFKSKVEAMVRGYGMLNTIGDRKVMISTLAAQDLSQIMDDSIDYIFTDPPYGYRVQYGELNFLWESWLQFSTDWLCDETIINDCREKSIEVWGEELKKAFAECYRVLRPGRAISVCYHDSDPQTWVVFQDLMAETGFITEQTHHALYIGTGQKTHKQTVSDNIAKRDLVITFRKPRPGEVMDAVNITGEEYESTFRDKLHSVIRDYLSANPGATKDRIYDEVISRLVRAGQMEAHNFDELLNQVADGVRENLLENKRTDLFGSHEMSRWYLKESEITAADSAESAREDAAARKIRDFISKWLADSPGSEGVHYSDIFERYVYSVKDKPRRSLADWLLDYFYKTESGTYRLPESEEEERIKTEARASGISRRIKHYVAHLQQGTPVLDRDRPSDATLVEWIRHCKRSGLYEQGKLIYERGGLNLDNLSEEAMVNVEEDYQVCARTLARKGANEKKTRRR